jgi:NAD(P)-dependent dehydrogenase (short-subunit alcohol dehydrogenase family)
VIGAGPGNGAAIGARFAEGGYAVALCARDLGRTEQLAARIPGARAYAYDVREVAAAQPTFERIRRDLGPIEVLVHNAGSGDFTSFEEATVESFQAAWEVNARGLFATAKAALPQMRAAGKGSIVVIGATASLRGGAGTASFASAKAAQRSLAQSMARHLGPQKIHVAYVILDGVVNLERTRQRLRDRPDEFFLEPRQIAESVYFLTQQEPQAWTFELDLRPFGERW